MITCKARWGQGKCVAERFVISTVTLEDIPDQHPVAVFARLWPDLSKKGDAALWENFSPVKLAAILPWSSVIERAEVNGRTVHYMRLQGSEIEKMAGKNAQGNALEDVLAKGALDERLRELGHIFEHGGYFLSKATVPFEGRDFIDVYRGVFAFTKSGEGVDKIVMVSGSETAKVK